ncbi:MAG: beta-lactamase family protein [Leptospiraceae bacterium]|nr:beta-lactamase family protein [Leptospiraceae bacterium]
MKPIQANLSVYRIRFKANLILLVCTTAVLSSLLQCHNKTSQQSATRQQIVFANEVDAITRDYQLPGLTAAYIIRDDAVRSYASGWADREARLLMQTNSRMLAASIGKGFIGALVLDLVREGKLDLDTPVSRYLGRYEWFDRLANHTTITLRHLLTHSAGIADHVHNAEFARAFQKVIQQQRANISPQELVTYILDKPALFVPGQGFQYSDTGYILVGLVIQEVTGQDPLLAVQRRFLEPLHLIDTAPSNSSSLARLASGYLSLNNPYGLAPKTTVKPGIMSWNPTMEWTGGGFISTAHDLAIWGKMLYEGRALEGDYLKEMLRSVPVRPGTRYGIATMVQDQSDGHFALGHRGWIPGTCSSMQYYPHHRIVISFQTNTDVGLVGQKSAAMAAMESRLLRALVPEDPGTRNEKP